MFIYDLFFSSEAKTLSDLSVAHLDVCVQILQN